MSEMVEEKMRQDKEEWVVSLDGENYNGYITYPAKMVNIQRFLTDI